MKDRCGNNQQTEQYVTKGSNWNNFASIKQSGRAETKKNRQM